MRREIDTPSGAAWADIDLPSGAPSAVLVIGHGAGGGVEARDIVSVRDISVTDGFAVVRVTQPYRVAGRRAPAPPRQLDAAWLAVIDALGKERRLRDVPLIAGGRSSGARVACRTATEAGARAVFCLAFPVHPPGRPEASRLDELAMPKVPVLVVQGDRDPFGMPPKARNRTIIVIEGADHGLKKELRRIGDEVAAFVRRCVLE